MNNVEGARERVLGLFKMVKHGHEQKDITKAVEYLKALVEQETFLIPCTGYGVQLASVTDIGICHESFSRVSTTVSVTTTGVFEITVTDNSGRYLYGIKGINRLEAQLLWNKLFENNVRLHYKNACDAPHDANQTSFELVDYVTGPIKTSGDVHCAGLDYRSNRKVQCQHLRTHDAHYFYCAAKPIQGNVCDTAWWTCLTRIDKTIDVCPCLANITELTDESCT